MNPDGGAKASPWNPTGSAILAKTEVGLEVLGRECQLQIIVECPRLGTDIATDCHPVLSAVHQSGHREELVDLSGGGTFLVVVVIVFLPGAFKRRIEDGHTIQVVQIQPFVTVTLIRDTCIDRGGAVFRRC